MNDDHDSLRDTFSVLASNVTADKTPDPHLEQRLMTEAQSRRKSPGRRTAFALAALMVVGIAGATVVVAGGVDAVMTWIITVEMIDPDGTRTEIEITTEGVFPGEQRLIEFSQETIDQMQVKGATLTLRQAQVDD